MERKNLNQSASIYPTRGQNACQKDKEAPKGPVIKESFIHYEFVAEQSNTAEARTLIRKHVMLEVQRRKRWQRGARSKEGSVAAVKTLAGPLTEVTTNSQSHRPLSSTKDPKAVVLRHRVANSVRTSNIHETGGVPTTSQSSGVFVGSFLQRLDDGRGTWDVTPPPSPMSFVGAVRADPFGMCTWGDKDPYLAECADFYFLDVSSKLFSSFRFDRNPMRLVSYALTSEDPVALYAKMSTSAILHSRWHNVPDNPRGIQYKVKAMQMIHERMNNPAQRKSNDLIVGITMLAASEVNQGDMKTACIHMQAIARLIDSRGGLKAIQLSVPMKAIIMWVEVGVACLTKTTPKHFLSEGFPTSYDLSSYAPPLPTQRDFSLYPEVLEIWLWSVKLFDELGAITALVKSSNHDEYLPNDLNRFAKKLEAQIHMILGPPGAGASGGSILLDTFRHITILYTSIVVQEYTSYPPLAGAALKKIKDSLLDDKDYRIAPVYYMLRALLYGTTAIIELPERTWFKGHCIHAAMTMSYEQWAELDETIAGYLQLEINNPSYNHVLDLQAIMGEYAL